MEQAFSKSTPYDKKSKCWTDIKKAIYNTLMQRHGPFPKRNKFQDMIKTLDPRYMVTSHKYFNETEMPKLYEQLREKVEEDLHELKYSTTTTDLSNQGA